MDSPLSAQVKHGGVHGSNWTDAAKGSNGKASQDGDGRVGAATSISAGCSSFVNDALRQFHFDLLGIRVDLHDLEAADLAGLKRFGLGARRGNGSLPSRLQ